MGSSLNPPSLSKSLSMLLQPLTFLSFPPTFLFLYCLSPQPMFLSLTPNSSFLFTPSFTAFNFRRFSLSPSKKLSLSSTYLFPVYFNISYITFPLFNIYCIFLFSGSKIKTSYSNKVKKPMIHLHCLLIVRLGQKKRVIIQPPWTLLCR